MVALLILAFALIMAVGNIVAVKPKPEEVWLDDIRMTARLKQLHPRLVVRPDWLPKVAVKISQDPYATPKGKGMVAQYGLVNDDWRLPQAYFLPSDEHWQKSSDKSNDKPQSDSRNATIKLNQKSERLHGVAITLGQLTPFVQGLAIKANSIAIILDDEKFAKTCAKRLDKQAIEQMFDDLKMQLSAWADLVNQP